MTKLVSQKWARSRRWRDDVQLFDVMERKFSGMSWTRCAGVTGCDLCEIERVEGENAVDGASVFQSGRRRLGKRTRLSRTLRESQIVC